MVPVSARRSATWRRFSAAAFGVWLVGTGSTLALLAQEPAAPIAAPPSNPSPVEVAPADASADGLPTTEPAGRRPEPSQVAETEKVAKKLLLATVTVRVAAPKAAKSIDDGRESSDASAKAEPKPNDVAKPNGAGAGNANNDAGAGGVTVASGVSVGDGWIVTFVNAAPGSRIRVTLPSGGESLDARVRVVDRYSGLTLLQIASKVPGVELAHESPAVGAALFTAAGSGVDAPLVSFGILGGVNRSVGAFLPPLLQCDLRTAASSGGAGVVDRDGKLVGVVVSTESSAERVGWTYAVPVSFVHRLIAHAPSDEDVRIVVLERRRPELGLTMRSGQEQGIVEVEHVREEGVAAQAGFQTGDVVLEADGVRVRSVYQAVALVMGKQPGDRLSFLIRRGARELRLDVTLGNAVKPTWLDADGLPELGVGSAFVLRRNGARVEIREMNFGASDDIPLDGDAARNAANGSKLPRDGLSLLREQMVRWSRVIEAMQTELQRRDDRIRELEAKIKELERAP